MNTLQTKHRFILTFATLLLSSCASPRIITVEVTTTPAPTTIPTRQPAPWPTEAWEHASPESQGMDSNVLVEMLKTIENEGADIDALVVVRNGFIVLDATVFPFSITPNARHNVYSCTKSVLSILVSIAIDEGYIEGVDQPVLTFFPEKSVDNMDARKEAMTLEHLLTMTTGLNCRDSYLYRWDGLYQMRSSPDWAQFMLDLPMMEDPGSYFEYCNGASFLLSAILQEVTGMSALEFAQEHLFMPLGITDVQWPSNPQGISIGYSDLELRPEDMAKIGYLYLNDGVWDGEQLVPSAWVQDSTRKFISATLQEGYGYQWWVDVSGIYMALGYGGQYIIVVPEEDLVVVFVSDLAEADFYVPDQLLHGYILPSILSSEALPEDPRATTLLRLYRLALQER
ncbi:MAG TPA: serine hydrolase [Anaerolineae bacterium]|nr:serine hydrolase [Anaerolineae bacterium]